jgi:hypothetical protein
MLFQSSPELVIDFLIHLLIETKENSSLSKIMQGINLAYTIWFNRKNGKVGHLWQDRHEIYEAMGKDQTQRQRAYREYICSNRDKEEQEIREKMGKGIIGEEGFQEEVGRKVIEAKRPRRGRPRK